MIKNDVLLIYFVTSYGSKY